MKTILHLERKFTSKTETFIINQVNSIKNIDVIVATIKYLKVFDCNKKIITPDGVSLFSKTGKFLSSKTKKNLLKKVSFYRVDLIHVHYAVDAFYFLPFLSNFQVPKIVSCYGYDVSSFPKQYLGLGKYLLKKVFEHCDYFLAMSEDMKKDLLKIGCPEEKIIIHYHGTDIERFYNRQRDYRIRDKIKLLMVGTIEEKKAQHYVIKALKKVIEMYDKIELHLVGDGDYMDYCRSLVKKLNLSNNVFFHGYISHFSNELIEFYNSADIFLLPSITLKNNDKEGIPGTIVESMANGLPVISTYHAGIPHIIKNGVEGILVKERDVDAISNAIILLIQNEKLREALGRNAQRKAYEELDLKIGTRNLEKIYSQILNVTSYKLN